MSTTDSRAAFEAWVKKAHGASCDKNEKGEYLYDFTIELWDAWKAATEAAKATGTAGELPLLPSGAETWFGAGFTADQMHSYGQACAKAARQSLMQLFLDPENQPTQYGTVLVEAARQPAPVVAVKTWQERFEENYGRKPFDDELVIDERDEEIADLRAALAARSQP